MVARRQPHASSALTWMGAALLGSVALAVASLTLLGTGQRGTLTGLQMTARWAYAFFWPAYAGGALAAVFGPVFQPVARRGRELGLAFAAAMLAHVFLIAWLYYISAKPPLPLANAVYFGVGLALAYLLALFSIPSLFARLPRPVWRVLCTLGMDYIALAFLLDFLHDPFNRSLTHLLGYLPFIALALAGMLLRLVFYARRARATSTRRRTGPGHFDAGMGHRSPRPDNSPS